MEGENSISMYKLKDFQRYRNGEMSFQEQHELEKRLLEDTFLFEAYEGFIASEENDIDYIQTSDQLNDHLQKRIDETVKKVLPLWLYISAASLVLGFGAIWFLYISSNKPIMQSAQKSETIPPVYKDAKADIDKPDSAQELPKSGIAIQQSPKSTIAPTPAQTIISDSKTNALALSSQAITSAQSDASRNNPVTSVTSRVTDENGKAVEGATIHTSGKDIAVTDTSGRFGISSRIGDSLPLANIGSMKMSLKVDRHGLGNIKMNTDTPMLNEVVVVGYGTSQKRSEQTIMVPSVIVKPEPVGGWESYQQYLRKATDSSVVKGQVKVMFTVNPVGGLSDFITNGAPELYESAIRIIKQGPVWQPAKVNGNVVSRQVEVIVKFAEK